MSDDDELTTDVDPAWVAAIRAEAEHDHTATNDEQPSLRDAEHPGDWFDDTDDDEAVADDGVDDTTQRSPADVDPEATVGASSDLIARIRSEISVEGDRPSADDTATELAAATDEAVTPPTVDEGHSSPTSPPAPAPIPAPAPASAPASTPGPPLPPPVVSQPRETPPAHPDDTRSTADADVSTTVRWEPHQRLSGTAHVADAPLATSEQRHHGVDRTKIAIAAIVAVTVVVLVWLFLRSDGSGEPPPPPDQSVPTETIAGGGGG